MGVSSTWFGRLAWAGLLMVSLAGVGCAGRAVPAYSLARYARANAGEQVRLTGAAAGGYGRETEPAAPGADEEELLLVPMVEAGGRLRLHELYSVTATVSTGMLTAEGLLRFGDQRAAIGIVHGVGGGLRSLNDTPMFELNLVGGVFAQFGLDAQNYILVGGRYVFDDVYGGEGPVRLQRGAHWISGGVGWTGQLFQFFGLGAELHGGVIARVDGQPTVFFIAPTVTVDAAF